MGKFPQISGCMYLSTRTLSGVQLGGWWLRLEGGISVVGLLWRELCLSYTSHLYLSEKSWAHCLKIALRWDRMKQAVDT